MTIAVTSFLLAASFATSTMAVAQAPTTTLAALRDTHRVLLVFANGDNAQAEAQLTTASTNAAGFRERDLLLVGLAGTDTAVPTAMLAAADEEAARKRFHVAPGRFTVLLLGKDGGEKLRRHAAIPWDVLQRTIDAMPMRRDEMHTR